VATWMELEDIILNKIILIQKCFHFEEAKKVDHIELGNKIEVTRS
jgi:hypothetical protein